MNCDEGKRLKRKGEKECRERREEELVNDGEEERGSNKWWGKLLRTGDKDGKGRRSGSVLEKKKKRQNIKH